MLPCSQPQFSHVPSLPPTPSTDNCAVLLSSQTMFPYTTSRLSLPHTTAPPPTQHVAVVPSTGTPIRLLRVHSFPLLPVLQESMEDEDEEDTSLISSLSVDDSVFPHAGRSQHYIDPRAVQQQQKQQELVVPGAIPPGEIVLPFAHQQIFRPSYRQATHIVVIDKPPMTQHQQCEGMPLPTTFSSSRFDSTSTPRVVRPQPRRLVVPSHPSIVVPNNQDGGYKSNAPHPPSDTPQRYHHHHTAVTTTTISAHHTSLMPVVVTDAAGVVNPLLHSNNDNSNQHHIPHDNNNDVVLPMWSSSSLLSPSPPPAANVEISQRPDPLRSRRRLMGGGKKSQSPVKSDIVVVDGNMNKAAKSSSATLLFTAPTTSSSSSSGELVGGDAAAGATKMSFSPSKHKKSIKGDIVVHNNNTSLTEVPSTTKKVLFRQKHSPRRERKSVWSRLSSPPWRGKQRRSQGNVTAGEASISSSKSDSDGNAAGCLT